MAKLVSGLVAVPYPMTELSPQSDSNNFGVVGHEEVRSVEHKSTEEHRRRRNHMASADVFEQRVDMCSWQCPLELKASRASA